MEYVALDLETTGLDAERDRVIEVGAVAFTAEGVLASIERLTDPGRSVPEAVLRLTGILPEELAGAPAAEAVMAELAEFLRDRQPVGHGARLDVDFLVAAGLWPEGREILDTLDIARILMPEAASHSLPVLATELSLDQPRPHRALDDADATRQLFLRLRQLAAALDERLKESLLALVAPYGWAIASFFAEALTAVAPPAPAERRRRPGAASAHVAGRGRDAPDDPRALVGLLEPGGPLAASLPDYEHREPQLEMTLAVAQIMRRGGRLVVEAGTGTGKALDVDTPIPTPSGWVRIGDLRRGDYVFDDQGQPTEVVQAFDVLHDRPCYEVVFSDGSTIVADHEHLWATSTRARRIKHHRYRARTKNFATDAKLDLLRAKAMLIPPAIPTSRSEIVGLIGGHSWSVRKAALDVPTLVSHGRQPRRATTYDGRTLLRATIDLLAADVATRKPGEPLLGTGTTAEIRRTLTVNGGRHLNHAVPVAGPVRYPHRDLPIAPYTLGAWLGDGSSGGRTVCVFDPEILDEIAGEGYRVTPLRRPGHHAVDLAEGPVTHRWADGVTKRLCNLGVLNNKHIPSEYLVSSIEQRRALLAGLLDTDGTISRTGLVEFTTTRAALAEGVRELACSLGHRATIRAGRARLRGKDCGPRWTVAFTTGEQVFRLPRKRRWFEERTRAHTPTRNDKRYIVDVRPVPSRPVRCIQVAAPSRLFLAGRSYIPTHNSLAYLVPALARAVRRSERVVVSTHTHTLQEQIVFKDIPSLRQWLPWDFEACLLKGRSNYVSLRRWRRYLAEPCRDADELKFKLKILVWLYDTQTGDRAELRLQGPEEGLWTRIASDPLDCVGLHCTPDDCFVHRARAEAERSDLVVVNHALLLADAATGGNLLPPYDHLVVDEAHHLEDAATHSLRCEVDGPALEALLARLAADDGSVRTGLIPELRLEPRLGSSDASLADAEAAALAARPRCAELFASAAEWARRQLPEEALRRDEAIRIVPEHRERADWPAISELAADAVTGLRALDAQLRRTVALSREWLGGEEPDQGLRELEIIRGRLAEATELLHDAIEAPHPNRVYWLSVAGRTNALVLRSAPVEVGGLLREQVFGELSSVVMTSASLAVAGSFDYFCSRVGLGAEVETLLLASPFDYLSQALVCLPIDIPDPTSEEFEPLVEDIVADVAARLGGRTLALFTSHNQLRTVYTGLKHRSDLDEVLILGQGIDGQRRQVLRAFEESDRPLLLGTSSFWEGVDIPGDRLSCVIIVRLPFAVPTEPVFAARAERLRDPFLQYALPQAALRLKQGFGRLIRSRDDRGAVIILDNRVLERDYGRAFLEALPPASRFLGPVELIGQRIELWLAAGLARSAPA